MKSGPNHIAIRNLLDNVSGLVLAFDEPSELATTSKYNVLTNSCNLLPITAHTESSLFAKSLAALA
jgi:hypothetical protein